MVKIYVQIASYRDHDLPNTVADALIQAEFPENLTFGICWQFGEKENPSIYDHDPRFRVIKIPSIQSRGACWARSLCNQRYQGEDFVLQVDSHTRFAKNWDTTTIDCFKRLQNSKAILTSYPAGFTPQEDRAAWHPVPLVIKITNLGEDVDAEPDHPHRSMRSGPWRARHFAAGFVFGTGEMIQKVPYDPEMYFKGEETSMAVRLFTNGFDLWHPDRHICWHHYTRQGSPRHWSDISDWAEMNNVAAQRLKSLLGKESADLGAFGIGKVRSLQDWINYSGIDYKRGILHLDVLENLPPPVNLTDSSRFHAVAKRFSDFVIWNPLKINGIKDALFLAFVIKDQYGRDLYRQDVYREEKPDIFSQQCHELKIEFDYFPPQKIPTELTLCPMSEKEGWLPFVTISLRDAMICGPSGLMF
jgi:hypothetical protein